MTTDMLPTEDGPMIYLSAEGVPIEDWERCLRLVRAIGKAQAIRSLGPVCRNTRFVSMKAVLLAVAEEFNVTIDLGDVE